MRPNNRYIKYFLIIGVVVIWSLIVINFVKGTSRIAVNAVLPRISTAIDSQLISDSFHLLNDYADPFIPSTDSPENDTIKSVPASTININRLVIDSLDRLHIYTMIQLHGIIGLANHKKMLGMVTINGQSYLVKEGQVVDNFAIKKIEKNRLQVLYKQKFYKIVKSQ